ncbi:hypothetical protein TW65_01074 [Stemphylium lycopersici]|nr:hypothetical protein TW65_01074 [Stemphylium lycopersici]
MSATATRRSTRRTAAAAASADPAQSASEQSSQQETPPPEAPKRKARKAKAASTKAESHTVTESQQTVTKSRATSRANAASATTTTTRTSATTTAQAPPVAKKLTRAGRAAVVEAGGQASPQRSLEEGRPKRGGRGTAQQKNASEKRKTVAAKLASKDVSKGQENEDDLGPFFSDSEPAPFIPPVTPAQIDSELLRQENAKQGREIDNLRARVSELEAHNEHLTQLLFQRDQRMLEYEHESLRLATQISRLQHHSNVSYGAPANHYYPEFDSEILAVAESSPPQPVFVNGTESALALLHKIESSAKEGARVEPSSNDIETHSDNHVTMEPSPLQNAKRTFTEVSVTPDRPVSTPSNFFSRSFSAIKSRIFSSTPKPPPTPEIASPTPTKPLPPQDTLTETLSLPPTPVGERVKTPSKRRAPTNTMMKVLLKGINHEDKRKAEDWARQVIPELRNDVAFREKRKRLETPVLFKDLSNFPSAKPWETGFGDPLGDLDDDDVVPAWAVYLDMKAEEEEHTAKKQRKARAGPREDDEVPTIDEQFAASNGGRTSPKLYNSHGQSASLYDFHPRRSIDPSPMFSNSVSHNEGGNIFSELQGHDTAAQIRENDREVLKSATKETVQPQTQKSVGSSFSVPDESDEEDSIADTETSDAEATPIWTQPPPPAPVPAHAPLPGGPATDAPASPPQQPVDEIERQRKMLMKHTPAKPSRLREATYPSPSLFSDAGNESMLAATPVQMTAAVASMFNDMPGAEMIELDDECQAAFDELVSSEEYKQQLTANDWPAATLTYESDEEELSPTSA